jgi:hypothetical protein
MKKIKKLVDVKTKERPEKKSWFCTENRINETIKSWAC